jgi:hypothetical protein
VIHFRYLRQKTDEEIYDELVIADGPGAVCPRRARRWVQAFAARRTELNDLPRSRRPRDFDNLEHMKELLNGNPYL